ncbi:hypothetical protein HMPREF1640_08815 [Prevotella sp. S7-1-8]|nr:hypothetical protein HMPREF1640_08815 [Prevotella sp. S7-1-8]
MGIFRIYARCKRTAWNAPKSQSRKMKIYCKKLDKRSCETLLFTKKKVCGRKHAKIEPSYQATAKQQVTPKKAFSQKKCPPDGSRLSDIRMLIRH